MIFKFRSPAKLNLFLKIKNKRKDGFHNLETIFERIDLCDKISIVVNDSGEIKVCCDKKICPQKSNLAYRAAKLIKETFNIREGISIKIKKVIPVGSGLGGASSNAATVLLALNKILKLNLSKNKLISSAKELGSDVPFFILETSCARGYGRGEILKPILVNRNIKFWHVLVVPKFRNLTKDMYRKFDDLALTKQIRNDRIKCLQNGRIDFKDLKENLFNSFELIAGSRIKKIKDRFLQLNVKYVVMSGSGSAVFGILDTRKEAIKLTRQLKAQNMGKVFIARTY